MQLTAPPKKKGGPTLVAVVTEPLCADVSRPRAGGPAGSGGRNDPRRHPRGTGC